MNEKHYAQMYAALQRIKHYQTPERMKRFAKKEWGLDDANEAIEMAYENVLEEAKGGLRGVRPPRLEARAESVKGVIGAGSTSTGE